jgi:hypothetical protein
MKLNAKEIEAVSKLDDKKRYEYFIKKVADWETAWGLNDNGWALYGDNSGKEYFPMWPAKEYANLCASGEWVNYKPEEISLEYLRNELLKNLDEDGVNVAIFMTPTSRGSAVTASALLSDLEVECKKYE